MLTTKMIANAVNEAIQFGETFLGDMSFDVLKDAKKVNSYLKKNSIEDVYLVHFEENDNVKDCFGGQAIGWYLIAQ